MTWMTLVAVLAMAALMPVYAESVPPPLKQWNEGIPLEQIRCNADKILMEKNTRPICVTEGTAEFFSKKGYAIVQQTNTETKHTTITKEPDEHITEIIRGSSLPVNLVRETSYVNIPYPEPTITYEFSNRFVIGEPVTLSYTYEFDEKDHENYLLYRDSYSRDRFVYFYLELPDEFTTDLERFELFEGDQYTTHTTILYYVEGEYSHLKSGSGEITITLTEEMMFNYDRTTFIMADYTYESLQVIKTEFGAHIKTEEQLGGKVVTDKRENSLNDEIDFQIIYIPPFAGKHIPSEKPELTVRGEAEPNSGSIFEANWDAFAVYLRDELERGSIQNVTQFLIGENLSYEFIDDFLDAYPEFRTQSVDTGGSASADPSSHIFMSGTYHIHARNGTLIPAAGLNVCMFDVNLSDHDDVRVLKNGNSEACDIANSIGFFSITGINDDPNDNTNADIVAGIKLKTNEYKILNITGEIYRDNESIPRENFDENIITRLNITTATKFADPANNARDIHQVSEYFRDNFSYVVPLVYVLYDENDHDPRIFKGADQNSIIIGSRLGDNGVFEIDSPTVIMHEYGHHIQDSIYNELGSNLHGCSGEPHSFTIIASDECVWSEGWAAFVPAMVLGTPVLDAVYTDVNLESGKVKNDAFPGPDSRGWISEGWIAAALWDIIDDAAEEGDDISNKAGAMWDAFNDSPARTIHEFEAEWDANGQPDLSRIFDTNKIRDLSSSKQEICPFGQVCGPVPGAGIPVISIDSIPQNQTSGTIITLDASGSTDDGNTLIFEWFQKKDSRAPAVRLKNADTAVASFEIPFAVTERAVILQFYISVSDGLHGRTELVDVPILLTVKKPTVPPPRDSVPGISTTVIFEEQWDNANRWTRDSEWATSRTTDTLLADTNNRVISIEECDDSCPLRIKDAVELYSYDGADLEFWVWFGGDILDDDILETEVAMVQVREPGGWEDKHMIMVGQSSHERWFSVTINMDEFARDDFFFRFVPMLGDNEGSIELDALRIIAKTRDNTPPVIAGTPEDIIMDVVGPVEVSYDLPTATDNLDGKISVYCNPPSGVIFDPGRHTVTCRAADSAQNKAETTFDIVLNLRSDTTPPVITAPPDKTFEATAALSPLNLTQIGAATATDDLDTSPSITSNATSLFELGNTTISWTATDSAGNNATAAQRITIQDTTAPIFAGTPLNIMIGSAVPVPVTFDIPVASDIFPVRVSCIPDSGHTFPVADTLVICTATDSSDNMAEISFRVMVANTDTDTMPPVITAPADMTFEATGVLTPLNHTQYGTATATDDMDSDPAITSDAPASFDLGRTIITWIATDSAGNNSTATQTITVQDTTPPEFGDASLLLFPLEEGRDNTNLSNAVPAASDLVDGTIIPECEPDPSGQFGNGAYTLTCTASDGSDNHINATRIVIVYEGQEPRMQSVGDSGIAFVGNDYIHLLFQEMPGKPGYKCVIWTDNYNERTINFTDGSPCSYDMLEPQTVYAINVVPRGAGEKAIFPYTRVFTEIHLRDTVLPVISAPDDITAEATGLLTDLDMGSATVTDNMDSNPIITSNDTGPYKLGTTIIRWSATDYSGNTATALQRVIIQDTTRPIFTDALPDIRRESRVPISITFDTPNATDIFPVTVSCTPESGSTFAVGTHTVSCTAADPNGNTAVSTFKVTITNGAVFQSITDNFENLDGWRPYHIQFSSFEPVNGYTISVANNTGRPAPSAVISGDGFGLQVGMERIVSLENHTPGDPIYLGIDYRATSDTAAPWVTNAILRISHERGWPLLVKYFLLGDTADTGWRSHSMDISDIVSDRPRVRIQLILLDIFEQDHNHKAYYDNFYLGTMPPPSAGAAGQAEHTITYEQLGGFLDETGAVCAVYPDVSLQPLIDRYIEENNLDVRCG